MSVEAISAVSRKRPREEPSDIPTQIEQWERCRQVFFKCCYASESEFMLDYSLEFYDCKEEFEPYWQEEGMPAYLSNWARARVKEMDDVLKKPIKKLESNFEKLPFLFQRIHLHMHGKYRDKANLEKTYSMIDTHSQAFNENIPIFNGILANIQDRIVDYRAFTQAKDRIHKETMSEDDKTVTYPALFGGDPIVIDKEDNNWFTRTMDIENFYEIYRKCLGRHEKFLRRYVSALVVGKQLVEKGRPLLV